MRGPLQNSNLVILAVVLTTILGRLLWAQELTEPNDTPEQAITLKNGLIWTDSIQSTNDVDWFKITIVGPTPFLRVETDGEEGDTELWLYGPDDPSVQRGYDDDLGKESFSLIFLDEDFAPPPGTYWIQVRSFEHQAEIPSYTLTASWVAQPVAQTIVWERPSGEVLELHTPHPLSASASSGLPVSFKVESGPGRIEGDSLVITNWGRIVVLAEQPGNEDYLPAALSRSFNAPAGLLTFIGAWRETGFDAARGVEVRGNHAFLAMGRSGLQILNVREPGNPSHVGGFDSPGFGYDIAVSGMFAYLADAFAGLQVINIGDPGKPVFTGNQPPLHSVRAVTVSGPDAYLADGYGGLQIVDVSNPSKPRRVGIFQTSGPAEGVAVANEAAYIADGRSGLQVINTTNPGDLTLASTLDTDGFAADVAVAGDYIYLADGYAGVQIIDTGSPGMPKAVGTYLTDGFAEAIEVVGNYLFIAAGTAGLHVIDVRDHGQLQPVAVYLEEGNTFDVAVIRNLVYLAGSSGLTILRPTFRLPQNIGVNLPVRVVVSESPLTLVATSSSGLPVTMSVVAGPATLAGDQLRLAAVGEVRILVEQAGDEHFLPAAREVAVSVVAALPLTLGIRALDLGLEVFWPQGDNRYQLQQSSSMSSDSWVDASLVPTPVEDEFRVRLDVPSQPVFFRLLKK